MNPVAFEVFGIPIAWYAILIVSGLLIGILIAVKETEKHDNITKQELSDFIFFLILFAFIGARTWYVIFDFDTYSDNLLSIFQVKQGGLAIHGGITAGFLYILYYTKKHKKNLFLLTDIAVPSLLLGQAIGRWGNFINQEAHGGVTTEAFLSDTLHLPQFIVDGMYINGAYYQPTFLYESIWNFIGFLILIIFLRKRWRFNYGYITAFYLMWYGFIRTFIEMMRTDALTLFSTDIRVALVTSFAMFIAGVILMTYLVNRNMKENNNV